MPPTSGIGHALSDPLGSLLQLLTGVLTHLLATARVDLDGVLTHYLYSTVDPSSSGRPLTANPSLIHLNGTMAAAADILVAAVVLFASLRSMFEHQSLRPKYTLKVMLPRLLAAIVLVHGSIYFMQMAIDLNNAVSAVAVSTGTPLTLDQMPWSSTLDPSSIQAIQVSEDLFH